MGVRHPPSAAMSDLVRDSLSGKWDDLPPDLQKLKVEVLQQLASQQVADAKREGRFRGDMMLVFSVVFCVGAVGSIVLFLLGALDIVTLREPYLSSSLIGSGVTFVVAGTKLVVSWTSKSADKR
jgi:hypothetical protein